MKTARQDETGFDRWAQDQLRSLRPWLSGRRVWWIAAVLALAAGTALSWSWLVAIGLAPLLVAALPCAAMCALGLCMNRMMGRSCSKEAATGENPPKAEASIAAPLEFAHAGSTFSRADVPAKSEEKETVSAENAGRGA